MSVNMIEILNQPGWNYKLSQEGVLILAPSKHDATLFAQSYGYALTETAAKFQGKVQIGWKRCKQPIEFYNWMAIPQAPSTLDIVPEQILPTKGAVFCSQSHLPVELLRRMVKAAENERPVSIVRQDNHKQIIVNQAMSDLLQTPPEVATQRVMTRFWLPEDLTELERRLRIERQFTWTYSGGLNERTWAILTTEFEAFEVEGIWYRQGTFLTSPRVVPIPAGAFAPA